MMKEILVFVIKTYKNMPATTKFVAGVFTFLVVCIVTSIIYNSLSYNGAIFNNGVMTYGSDESKVYGTTSTTLSQNPAFPAYNDLSNSNLTPLFVNMFSLALPLVFVGFFVMITFSTISSLFMRGRY